MRKQNDILLYIFQDFEEPVLWTYFPRIREAPAANSATVNARRRKLPTGIINYSDENCML
jgi:hypothetical protein